VRSRAGGKVEEEWMGRELLYDSEWLIEVKGDVWVDV
jgi:hypothetical protein